jgi:hypothetical protein
VLVPAFAHAPGRRLPRLRFRYFDVLIDLINELASPAGLAPSSTLPRNALWLAAAGKPRDQSGPLNAQASSSQRR